MDQLSLLMEKPVSKRQDPNYIKITADVPKELATKVRVMVTLTDISFSEAVEQALLEWVEKRKDNVKFEI